MGFPKFPGYKDPDDLLDYAIEWANRLEEGETLAAAVVTLVETETTVEIEEQGITGTRVVFWLSGGRTGETVSVQCRINTDEGRQMDQTIQLKIKTK